MEAQKDFGRLLHDYENFTKRPKKPIYKDPKYFFVLIAVVVLTYVIYEITYKENKTVNTTQQQK